MLTVKKTSSVDNWQKSLGPVGSGFKKTFMPGLLPIGEICISPGFSLGCDLAFE